MPVPSADELLDDEEDDEDDDDLDEPAADVMLVRTLPIPTVRKTGSYMTDPCFLQPCAFIKGFTAPAGEVRRRVVNESLLGLSMHLLWKRSTESRCVCREERGRWCRRHHSQPKSPRLRPRPLEAPLPRWAKVQPLHLSAGRTVAS